MAWTFKPELDDDFIKWVASSYDMTNRDQVIQFARKIMEYQVEKCASVCEEATRRAIIRAAPEIGKET